MALIEPEILWARRAFPTSQVLLAGPALSTVTGPVATGWHDTQAHEETGAFAVVAADSGLADLIGEILQVSVGRRSVFVYCIGSADVPTDLSLARRAFAALALLATESVGATVAVVA